MISHRTVVPHPATELRARNILAVASGKGGVGKTWLSISLSHFLAREGQRVLLFDGDLGLANVDVQLGLTPAHDISSVITGRSISPTRYRASRPAALMFCPDGRDPAAWAV